MKRLLAAGCAALLAGCAGTPTASTDRYGCTYPGAAVQCRGLNPG